MFSCVLREKIRVCANLKKNTANYISLERLINVDFQKTYMNCQGFFNSQTKIANMTAKMTIRHSIRYLDELIGYQNSADF